MSTRSHCLLTNPRLFSYRRYVTINLVLGANLVNGGLSMSNELVVDAFIEIPTGSQNKYEYDKEAGNSLWIKYSTHPYIIQPNIGI